jgi:hypothetical protein
MARPIAADCKRDRDAMLLFYFSRKQDSYSVLVENIDFGDALIVISHLIGKFGLSPEAIAEMGRHDDSN